MFRKHCGFLSLHRTSSDPIRSCQTCICIHRFTVGFRWCFSKRTFFTRENHRTFSTSGWKQLHSILSYILSVAEHVCQPCVSVLWFSVSWADSQNSLCCWESNPFMVVLWIATTRTWLWTVTPWQPEWQKHKLKAANIFRLSMFRWPI